MILLTDEEIAKLSPEDEGGYTSGMYYYYNDGIRDGAKAQLKRVDEWGSEWCPHVVNLGETGTMTLPKRACKECWQALKKECE